MAVQQVAGVALAGGAAGPSVPGAPGLRTALLERWFLALALRTARPREAALLTLTPG